MKLIYFLLCIFFHNNVFAQNTVTFREMSLNIVAEPFSEKMSIEAELQIDLSQASSSNVELVWQMTKPKNISSFINSADGANVTYRFETIPGIPNSIGVQLLYLTLPSSNKLIKLKMSYDYDQTTFAGWAPNPATGDSLHLGQLNKNGIYNTHLNYYPTDGIGPEKAQITFNVPEKWQVATSGQLIKKIQNQYQFEYAFSSGRLPYAFSIYPYSSIQFNYDNTPIAIYFDETDRAFAEEKAILIEKEVLPFLQSLFGDFPFQSLNIVEVFPSEGNTGVASKGQVTLSKNIWFAKEINNNFSSPQAMVIVDEIAHQWNFYSIQLPNYLAEGFSQYVDSLFLERMLGTAELDKKISEYTQTYNQLSGTLNQLQQLQGKGLTIEEAANQLSVKPEQIASMWPYAQYGERPISEGDTGTVFPALYFIKGALALHALKKELGDVTFYQSIKALFNHFKNTGYVDLPTFQKSIESTSGKDLNSFFDLWYKKTGLP